MSVLANPFQTTSFTPLRNRQQARIFETKSIFGTFLFVIMKRLCMSMYIPCNFTLFSLFCNGQMTHANSENWRRKTTLTK